MLTKEEILEGLELLKKLKEKSEKIESRKEMLLATKSIIDDQKIELDSRKPQFSPKEIRNATAENIMDNFGKFLDVSEEEGHWQAWDYTFSVYDLYGIEIFRYTGNPDFGAKAITHLSDQEILEAARRHIPAEVKRLEERLHELESTEIDDNKLIEVKEKYMNTPKWRFIKRKNLLKTYENTEKELKEQEDNMKKRKEELIKNIDELKNISSEELLKPAHEIKKMIVSCYKKIDEVEKINKEIEEKEKVLNADEENIVNEMKKVDAEEKEVAKMTREIVVKLGAFKEDVELLKKIAEDEQNYDLQTRKLATKIVKHTVKKYSPGK